MNNKMDKEELDYQIGEIHRSTKSHFCATNKLHNYLRKKNKRYYDWHTKPFTSFLHYSIAILIVAIFFFFVIAVLTTYGFEKYIVWLEGVI